MSPGLDLTSVTRKTHSGNSVVDVCFGELAGQASARGREGQSLAWTLGCHVRHPG